MTLIVACVQWISSVTYSLTVIINKPCKTPSIRQASPCSGVHRLICLNYYDCYNSSFTTQHTTHSTTVTALVSRIVSH